MPGTTRRVRQIDIARMAGVSQATVSQVLSGSDGGRGHVAEETRARVLEVVRRTGYVVDPVARRLARGHNGIVGVFTYEPVFPRDGEDFYFPFLTGIERAAETDGLDLLLFTSAPVRSGRRRLLDDGARRLGLADGCLLLGRHDDKQDLAQLIDQGFPFVFVGRRESDAGPVPHVGADYAGATRQVVADVLALGHETVGFLGDLGSAESHVDRRRGYLAAMTQAGRRPVLVDVTGLDAETVLDTVLANALTAVVVDDLVLPRPLLEAARRRGLAVPGDLSLARLGDPASPDPDVEWTGFRVPREEMGAAALHLLAGLVSGERTPEECMLLLPCTPDRGATAGPPAPAARPSPAAGSRA